MIFSGFVIHHKDCILKFIDRATTISQKCNFKFNIEEIEDYSWKIEDFQKLHMNFYFSDKIGFTVLLKFLNELMLKEPTEIEKTTETVDFGYYTISDQFGSTKDNEGFGVFVINKESVIFNDEN